jgi:hypothetical protein
MIAFFSFIIRLCGWLGASLVAHSTTLKVQLATTARTYFNIGTGSNQAIRFKSSGGTLLATVPLNATPWGAPDANGIIAAAITGAGTATVLATGTVTLGEIVDKDGSVCATFSVGTAGQDANYDAVAWTQGATITLSSLTYQQP